MVTTNGNKHQSNLKQHPIDKSNLFIPVMSKSKRKHERKKAKAQALAVAK